MELEPRIERRQERALWRLTWGNDKKTTAGLRAGGDTGSEEPQPRGGRKPAANLIGPKLTQEEVNKARDRAPVGKGGALLCWGYLTHSGCQSATCRRAHENLKGAFEALDPAVQMQLLRRGGLRRMKQETADSVKEKIQALRQGVQKDKASKVSKPKRKAGADRDEEATEKSEEVKAGGATTTVRFNDVPGVRGGGLHQAGGRQGLRQPQESGLGIASHSSRSRLLSTSRLHRS